MKIHGSIGLVTGADRGLGRIYARELVARGAAKVYGAARDPAVVSEPGVTPISLEITDPEHVAHLAERCDDVTLLVNNAGVMLASSFVGSPRRREQRWARFRWTSTDNNAPSRRRPRHGPLRHPDTERQAPGRAPTAFRTWQHAEPGAAGCLI